MQLTVMWGAPSSLSLSRSFRGLVTFTLAFTYAVAWPVRRPNSMREWRREEKEEE